MLVARLQMRLQREFGIDVPIKAIYANPTVAGLAEADADASTTQAVSDATAGLGDVPAVPERSATTPPRHVLLTGASGFLGVYLLEALLRRGVRVTCLVRARTDEDALRAMRQRATDAGRAIDWQRVDVARGDLGLPDLGLTAAWRGSLARHVDAIVHCGAWVHHRLGYRTLRATNVVATGALLRLALEARRKTFCLVSTESVGHALQGVSERGDVAADAAAHPPASDMGYVLSKWVAEQWVADAHRRFGLDAIIARPGNITGDTRTGYSNYASNHFWRLVKGCVTMGRYPETPMTVEMTPVDVLAERIAALSTDAAPGLRVANLGNPTRIPWSTLMRQVAEIGGWTIEACPAAEWQRALAAVDETHPLWSLRDLYLGDPSAGHGRDLVEARAPAADVETLNAEPLLALYVRFLQTEGYLPT